MSEKSTKASLAPLFLRKKLFIAFLAIIPCECVAAHEELSFPCGGHINAYSEVGKGTTFKIYLPHVKSVSRSEMEERSSAAILLGHETILLVEDDEQVRTIAQVILESAGYHVLSAATADEAKALAGEHRDDIDLILTDLVMPVMSGRELVNELSKIVRSQKVIYMSGYTDDAVVRHGLLDQDLAFLHKPFTVESLTSKLREVLDKD